MKKSVILAVCLFLFVVFSSLKINAQGTYEHQPILDARAVNLIFQDGLQFKDLDKNGRVNTFEDWRQPVEKRVADLLAHMTLEEKCGMLLINTLNSGAKGELTDQAVQYILDEKMTRFIFRNTITATWQILQHSLAGSEFMKPLPKMPI